MTILTGPALNYAITATAGSGFLLFGYDQGVMSGLLTGKAFTATFPEIDTNEGANGSSSLQGTVVAIYEIGCFFGAIFCFLFGEKLGRRRCIMIGCVVLSLGAVLQAAAFGIPQMIVGRIVAGLGNGMNTSTIRKFIFLKKIIMLKLLPNTNSCLAFRAYESQESRSWSRHRTRHQHLRRNAFLLG